MILVNREAFAEHLDEKHLAKDLKWMQGIIEAIKTEYQKTEINRRQRDKAIKSCILELDDFYRHIASYKKSKNN